VEQPPSLFVLAGNFQSYDANAPSTHYGRLREQFVSLGRLLNQFPTLKVGEDCFHFGWLSLAEPASRVAHAFKIPHNNLEGFLVAWSCRQYPTDIIEGVPK